jgi:hypothetical protein
VSQAAAPARKRVVVRLFAVHMLSYAVAFPWGVAAVPAVFAWKESELLALGDERDAVVLVLKTAAWPVLAAFVVPHLVGLPWALAPEGSRRGWLLLVGGCTLLVVSALGIAIFAWAHVLRG